MKKISSFIYYIPGLLLLVLMLAVPSSYQTFKMILLLIVFVEVFCVFIITNRYFVHKKILYLFIFYELLGLCYGLYGFLQDNPGALPITKEIVMYPLFYMILISGLRSEKSVSYLNGAIIFGACFASLYIVATLLNKMGIWPDWLYYDLSTEESTQSLLENALSVVGRFEMVFSSYCNYMFLQPYLFFLALVVKGRQSKVLWISAIICTLVMIFSSSRALLLVSIILPILILLFISFWQKNFALIIRGLMFISILLIILTGLLSYLGRYGFEMSQVWAKVARGFSPVEEHEFVEKNPVENSRIGQTVALFNAWKAKPAFGYGSGAACWDYLRSDKDPYSYEVSFLQFLFNWGIVGCVCYGLGFLYIFSKSVAAYKKGSYFGKYALAANFGCFGLLMGSWTNPYLLRFDSLYTVFIPIALVNLYLFESVPKKQLDDNPSFLST
jgi:hypothetical protein